MATQLGLRANWPQFALLVLINAFVGGMVGLERTILPRLAEQEFHLVARSAIFSFIVVFGLTKAVANYYAGAWAGGGGGPAATCCLSAGVSACRCRCCCSGRRVGAG